MIETRMFVTKIATLLHLLICYIFFEDRLIKGSSITLLSSFCPVSDVEYQSINLLINERN